MPRKNRRILPAVLAAGSLATTLAKTVAKGNKVRLTRPFGAAPTILPVTQTGKSVAPAGFAKAMKSANASAMAAPVAIGSIMRGSNWQFGAAPVRNGQSGIRITGRQLWATIATNNPPSRLCILPIGSTLPASVANLTFDPDDVKTMPPPMTSLAEVFSRYCLRRARVVFTPQAATSNPCSLGLAVLTDAALVNVFTPSLIQVMEMANSVSGPLWANMSIDVPCDETLRYTYQSDSDAKISVAEQRQDHAFGIIGAFSENFAALANQQAYGYLHLEYCCDFYEPHILTNEQSLARAVWRSAFFRARLLEQRDGPSKAVAISGLPLEEKKERKEPPVLLVTEDDNPTPPPSARSAIPTEILPVPLKRQTASGWSLVSR